MAKFPIFWKVYLLFFCIPFPMVIYYAVNFTGDQEMPSLTNPYLAITCLAIIVLLWSVLIVRAYKWQVASIGRNKRKIEELMRSGKKIPALVLRSSYHTGNTHSPYPEVRAKIQFENFSGTSVTQELVIPDSKPELKRYEAGNTLQLRVDPALKPPHCLPDGVQISIDKQQFFWSVLGWVAMLLFFVGYLLFSYAMESKGNGWRFLSPWHPLMIIPLSLGFFSWVFGRITSVFGTMGPAEIHLVFYGKAAVAQMIQARQTGTYINNQPQVRFDLQFTDDKGFTQEVSLKKIVDLLDMGITGQKEIRILYLPEDPQKIMFNE